MKEVVIVSVARTALGSFGGKLAGFSAIDLGSKAISEAVVRAGIQPEQVEEVIMGNVCSANLGQAPARQAALRAGLSPAARCTTINKVCASGTKAVMYAAQGIALGQADIVVAGGMESMSNVPFYVPNARFGYKYGNGMLVDGLEKDGLLDVYDQKAMGVFADRTAFKYGVSRADQDSFTTLSYQKAASANFSEIFPIEIPSKKGQVEVFQTDEEINKVLFEKIPSLRPAFSPDGTVTAASSSPISDGAAALLLMSAERAKALGLQPLAKIRGFADAEQAPEWFTTAPTLAVPRAVKMAGLSLQDIDFFEVNEAFAVVPLAFASELSVSLDKINAFGGAVALGHPLGCSGARIITTLVSVLQNKDATFGVAGICNGGGGASAVVIERLN